MTKKNKQNGSSFGELIKTLLIAGAIAISFRSLVAEPFNIPSGSMIPTLLVGDYLFVSKYSFGYSRYSFPFGIMPISERVFSQSAPSRGDVAVFRLPSNTSVDYIKRIIGLPGDSVQIKKGRLFINGKIVNRRMVGHGSLPENLGIRKTALYQETLPNGVSYVIQEVSDRQLFDNTNIVTVPEGHYFMMGDNRDNSRDSRSSSVGFVPYKNFIGRAEFLFFSHDRSASFWQIWKWPTAIRFERLFSAIR